MMATEATAQNPVDVSALDPSHTESAVANPGSQHVGPSRTTLNGSPNEVEVENKQIADIVDDLVNSAEASVSGGSDTEAFKGDPSKSLGDKSHVRNSSTVKKPQSFKSVSVNRTFLASKGALNSTSRPETTTGSASATPQPAVASSASRLKLVAKSGSNLGGSTKTLSTNGKPASAPDPNLVWNRNRVPPPPEPKKLSDEELVKEYGIHLAHRLGPEDTKGESNWADIEDDDEWEPETITWTDGTKVTLPHSEEQPTPQLPVILPADSSSASKDPGIVPKPKSPAPVASASGSPSIKPGVLASGKGLVLKGVPEKPTLVAKPPAPPTPVKSPWAPLPPVEKLPVVMDLPGHAQASRYPLRDASNTKSATPPPAKEIAADDFSRTAWRDNHHTNPNKELFNSQSGRYEPVSDRRGSRNDIHSRQPAVLQRPPHQEQGGPAEPSAAFQTSRTSAQEGPYGRRRGSSNVSGGSGVFAHRLNIKTYDMAPPADMVPAHGRPASIASGAESPVSHRTFSPANNQPANRGHPSQTYQPRPSPVPSHATPYQHQPNPEVVNQEQFETQKKYMTARREEAIRRRLEQEAREEEAKKARIAEKLKAMGPAPERKSAKKEVSKDEVSVPGQTTQRTGISASERSPETAHSPSIAVGSEVSTSEKPVPEVSTTSDNTITPNHSRPEAPVNGGSKDAFNQSERIHGLPPQSSATTHAHQSGRQWTGASQHQERMHPWSRGAQGASNNVWAPPGSSSGLGNGVFNADIGSLPDSNPIPFSQKSHPGPIAPPRAPPPDQILPPELAPKRLDPIAPPHGRSKQYGSQKRATSPDPRSGAWKSFAAGVKADDAERREERLKRQSQLDDSAFNPRTQDTWRPVEINKDGKRTALGTNADVSSNAPASWNNHGMNGPVRDRPDGTTAELGGPDGIRSRFGRQAPAGPSRTAAPGPPTQARSESRFFPASKEMQQAEIYEPPDMRTKSPTPPPPTADGHPVYDGDATRPHVALPPQKIRVRLPPSSQPTAASPSTQASRSAPISFAAAAAAPVSQRGSTSSTNARPSSRGVGYGGMPQSSNELISQENWQDKINVLMGKKAVSPAKSMPVDSSSKVAIEHTHTYDPPVSLPPLSPCHTDSTDSSITSKEMAEECFGEQEMGSLPNVRLPNNVPDAAWQAVTPNWNPAPARLRVDPMCAEAIPFDPEYANGKTLIRISTPGMTDVRTVTTPLANSRSQSNPRRSGPRGSSRRISRGGQRGVRDSSEHPVDLVSSSPSGRAMSSRGGRSHSHRPRTENWGRHTSSTPAAQS